MDIKLVKVTSHFGQPLGAAPGGTVAAFDLKNMAHSTWRQSAVLDLAVSGRYPLFSVLTLALHYSTAPTAGVLCDWLVVPVGVSPDGDAIAGGFTGSDGAWTYDANAAAAAIIMGPLLARAVTTPQYKVARLDLTCSKLIVAVKNGDGAQSFSNASDANLGVIVESFYAQQYE